MRSQCLQQAAKLSCVGDIFRAVIKEGAVHEQRHFILMMALAAATATSAFGQSAAPIVGPASTQRAAASIRDFLGIWFHPSFSWIEQPALDPGPITDLSQGVPAAGRAM
jgi:hypothetical protein